MGEINERESELRAARDEIIEREEENRILSVGVEKIKNERDFLIQELKTLQLVHQDLKVKYDDKSRLL